MACIRHPLLHGAAILALLAVGGIGVSLAADHNGRLPLVIAQANPPAEVQESQQSQPELLPEQDPVATAEKAVDDARAALRNAMATGGDVRAARRDLQAALRHLNEVKSVEKAETEGDEEGAQETSEVPALASPSEAPSPPLPATADASPQTLPPPDDTGPVAASPATGDGQLQALPPRQAAPRQQLAVPPGPALPPSAALPSLPAPSEAPRASDVATSPDAQAPQQQPDEASAAEASAAPQPETQNGAERPGFFRRLFGTGDGRPRGADKQGMAAADQDGIEAESETVEADDSAPAGETAGEPSLPIFKKLPPLQGPKVVNVKPADAEIVETTDENRVIVKKDGRMTIIHDDNDRFRRKGEDVKVESGKGGTTITTVTRRGGIQVVTVRDRGGDILQRYRKKTNGEIEMLIGERHRDGRPLRAVDSPPPVVDRDKRYDFAKTLPALVIPIPSNQYILGSQDTSRFQIQQALVAPPVEAVERAYTLDEIQRSQRLRAKLRRIDIDTVNFEFGAATIAEDQVPNLQAIGNAISAIVAEDPSQVFLIEGHTDAVGSIRANLALSDRRAEAIAQILTFYFDIPPENLITQGYGEQYLKILTAGPERRNRRGTVRNITALLVGQR